MKKSEVGKNGEDIACKYLEKNGYKIIARNIHYSRFCELDIIAQKKDTTVFVEVKTRSTNSFGTPFEAITNSKMANIIKGIKFYISEHQVKKYQLDIVGITIKPEIKIEHLKNVAITY